MCKTCKTCNITYDDGENNFRTCRARNGDIKIRGTCKICESLQSKIRQEKNADKIKVIKKIYYQENKNKLDAYNKMWRQENKDNISKLRRIYYQENKCMFMSARKKYVQKNREKILDRERIAKFLRYRQLGVKDVPQEFLEVVKFLLQTKMKLRKLSILSTV